MAEIKCLELQKWAKNPYMDLLQESLSKRKVITYSAETNSFFAYFALKEGIDLVHLHLISRGGFKKAASYNFYWFFLVNQLILLRLLGVKIFWTVHNLEPHENEYSKLNKFYSFIVARVANALIVHAESCKKEIIKLLNGFRARANYFRKTYMV